MLSFSNRVHSENIQKFSKFLNLVLHLVFQYVEIKKYIIFGQNHINQLLNLVLLQQELFKLYKSDRALQ